jgi:hypothetical protein
MTAEELAAAVTAAGITGEQLTALIQTGAAIVDREQARAAIDRLRAERDTALAAYETRIQAAQSALSDIEAAIVAGK